MNSMFWAMIGRKARTKCCSLSSSFGGRSLEVVRKELENSDLGSRQTVARRTSMQLLQAVELMSNMKPALIHHDMKLLNIVADFAIGSEDKIMVKLTDFGCSVWATDTHQTVLCGDPFYMPPESSVHPKQKNTAYVDPSCSFNVHGVGRVYPDLLCPKMASPKMAFWDYWNDGFIDIDQVKEKSEDCSGVSDNFENAQNDLNFIQMLTSRTPMDRPQPVAAIKDLAVMLK